MTIDYDFFVKIWASIQQRPTTSRWDYSKNCVAGIYPIVEQDIEKKDRLIAHLKYYQQIYQPQWKYVSFSSDYSAVIVMDPIEPSYFYKP